MIISMVIYSCYSKKMNGDKLKSKLNLSMVSYESDVVSLTLTTRYSLDTLSIFDNIKVFIRPRGMEQNTWNRHSLDLDGASNDIDKFMDCGFFLSFDKFNATEITEADVLYQACVIHKKLLYPP